MRIPWCGKSGADAITGDTKSGSEESSLGARPTDNTGEKEPGGANRDAIKLQECSRTCKIFDMTRDDASEAEDEFCPEVLQITVPSTALLSTGGKEGHTPRSDDTVDEDDPRRRGCDAPANHKRR